MTILTFKQFLSITGVYYNYDNQHLFVLGVISLYTLINLLKKSKYLNEFPDYLLLPWNTCCLFIYEANILPIKVQTI